MKRLAAVRLVHWYHFVDETFRFAGSTFLFGDNGSGKSTVLDAIQLALVADLSQVRFNKAANEQSRRTPYGYVRHKLGSEDESRPGQVRYGRGTTTSHVMLSFVDDDTGKGFVCGVALEAFENDTSVHKWHWLWSGGDIDAVPALVAADDGSRSVRPLRDFRQQLQKLPGVRLVPDVGSYRDELRHRLGDLPDSFHRLIVKALDFRPLGEVRQFVFEYLLDERPIDTDALQRNLEHYKQLEGQAKDAEHRILELTAVCDLGQRILAEREVAHSHRFMSLRAAVAQHNAGVAAVEAALGVADDDARAAREEIVVVEARVAFFAGERERLNRLLYDISEAREIAALERDLEDRRRQRRAAHDAERAARAGLQAQLELLDELSGEALRDVRRRQPAGFADDEWLGAREPPAIVERLRQTLARDGALAGRDIGTWERRLDAALRIVGVVQAGLSLGLTTIRAEAGQLEREQAELLAGRVRYDDGVEALLHLLRSKLKGRREPRPLCELVEIGDPRWQDAVEGFLNTRRFDVIVAAEDFSRALSLYERHKRDYPLPGRGAVFIANVGLVDVEKIRAERRPAARGSLAERVVTDDDDARAYVDSVCGDIICVDDEQELRRHRRAITDSVMVYSNHVARQTPERVYARHVIGVAARVRRLEEIARRLADLSDQLVAADADQTMLAKLLTRAQVARTTTARLPELLEVAQQRPGLDEVVATLERQLASIDRRGVDALAAQRDAAAETFRVATIEHHGLLQRLDAAQQAATAVAATLEGACVSVDPERREVWETRFQRLVADEGLEQVRTNYERQAKIIEGRVENLVNQLVRQKTAYAAARGFVAEEAAADDVSAFADERDRWQSSKLPEYRARIERSREESIQQLAEDMIFRLREGLDDVRRQIDNLNRALREVRFGSDRYQFSIAVAAHHRAFHDLILQAAPETRSLTEVLSPTSARATLEDLFTRLTHADAARVKEELAERADYRAYFDYDIVIHHDNGTRSLYSRVAGDKSGGETQTPYYIAIFASAHRLYRAMSNGPPSCGLLLLDEAFAKMDESRVRATLAFARDLSLQLILAAPKERATMIAPHVTSSLYIHKDAQSGAPTVLDFTKELTAPVPGNGGSDVVDG